MTFHEVRSEAKASHTKRQHMYKRGGEVAAEDVHKHEEHLHKGEPKTKLRDGGKVEGRARGGRADRPGRKGSGKTTINIVMPQESAQPTPVPVPVRPPMPAPPTPGMPAPPGGGMPPRPPMAPPAGGMTPLAAGMPPGAPPVMPGRARGGKMTAGAGSGEGRLEKIEGKR